MENAVNYLVLTSDSAPELGRQVRELIGGGWQPFGGVALAELRGVLQYAQSMALYPEQIEEIAEKIQQ